MTAGLIDIGVNLTNKRLYEHADELIEQAAQAGVEQMVVTGTSLEHSEVALALCQRFPRQLVCTAGVHPHDASEWTDASGDRLRAIAAHDCVRAIGETGLDYNRMFSSETEQLHAFEQQLTLAVELGKPVFLHQRDAFAPFFELLSQYRPQLVGAVSHCFTGDRAALHALLDLDCHIGITGWICDERRGQTLREIVCDIPSDRLMLETDAPYLLPRDLAPKPRDKTNRPQYLPHILNTVAALTGRTPQQLGDQVLQTTRTFFGLR
jgi:TatD DNase family protein